MYESFFGLEDQPFRLSPDHRFFYLSAAHNRALAHLKFGLDQQEGFILITGEVGAGKTTLVEHLLSSLNPRHFVAANIVTTNLDQENLIRMIASSFGLTQEGLNKTSVFRNIERFLADSARQGRRCLLFVDEAQNLSITALEELRMLSNLQVNGKPALQSFLLGQPQFRETLARPDLSQLRQRVIASYHLGPLNEEETAAYILHRLEVAGWKGDPDFEGDALSLVYEFSDGIPRRVNTLTNRLLLNAYLDEAHVVSAEDVRAVATEIADELGQVTGFAAEDVVPFPRPASGASEGASSGGQGDSGSGAGSGAAPGAGTALTSGAQEDALDKDVPIPHVPNAHVPGEKAMPDGVLSLPDSLDNRDGTADGGLASGKTGGQMAKDDPAEAAHETLPLSADIPDFEDDESSDVIDLTIRASEDDEDLSPEAEQKLKRRALSTVIDFFGGRGQN